MLDGHRNQIAASDSGSVGSILSRHKKTKQSVGDSMKLASILSGVNGLLGGIVRPIDDVVRAVDNQVSHNKYITTNPGGPSAWKNSRDTDIGLALGGAGVIGGAYALGKHRGGKEKKATLPIQPPVEPEIQQRWRGRPAKMKDTANVAGAMEEAHNMLAPASTTAGPG